MHMKMNPVVWFELYVQDMARARKFYETVLGLKLEKLDTPDIEMLAFPGKPDMAGALGALVRMQGVPSGGSTMVYFRCEDCAVETGRVVAAGGRIQRDKISIGPYGFCSIIVDTEGNLLGLHSMA